MALTEETRHTVLGVLAMYSPENPLVVPPHIYRELVAKDFPLENVVEQQPLKSMREG